MAQRGFGFGQEILGVPGLTQGIGAHDAYLGRRQLGQALAEAR